MPRTMVRLEFTNTNSFSHHVSHFAPRGAAASEKGTPPPGASPSPAPACLAPLHVPLHPTQIYESIGGFAIFGILYATRDRFKTPGVRFWTMLILYGAERSFFEIFRDGPRGFLGPFSHAACRP